MSSGFQNPSGIGLAGSRPSELFRADLISAMKVPDSHQLDPNSYVEIKESWRTEWEAGVQVCADQLPVIGFQSGVRSVGVASNSSCEATTSSSSERHHEFKMPNSYMKDRGSHSCSSSDEVAGMSDYDIDELDIAWLDSVNSTRKYKGLSGNSELTEDLLCRSITILETKCYLNMLQAIKTEEALKIEYDESVVCDICRDPEREENNEMVFCDSCNVCVHQACYGVLVIPEGSWVCKPCGNHAQNPFCVLCMNRSGAMKRIKPGSGWAHISCALWIPEVKFGNVDRMEPITNIESIPSNRWNLTCSVCRRKEGACIQCSYPTCLAAYHVTCGFKEGLEMRTRLTSTGVINESYCNKHTKLRKTPTKHSSNSTSSDDIINRPNSSSSAASEKSSQLKHLINTFHEYTTPRDLAQEASIPLSLASLIRNYWILKRKSKFNHPLISELSIDFSSQRLPSGLQYQKTVPEDEDFLNIVQIRHNLEKARNLVYMVLKRERFKKQKITIDEEITKLELNILEEDESKANKQPLCLKRLGVTPKEDVSGSPTVNGDDNLSSNNSSSDTENNRMLRKKKSLRNHSTSDDDSLRSPRKFRKGSEGGGGLGGDGTNITTNGEKHVLSSYEQ